MKINTKSLLYGTFVLTAANFFVRMLGFIYRVFLSRFIGAEGMGLVQLISPLYMVSITLTASGIPTAVSRLIAQQKAVNNISGIKKTLVISLSLAASISLCITCILYLSMDSVAGNILKDMRTIPSLFIFTPCIIIIALGAVLKGYFYGLKDIHPSALAEIIEQIVRMGLVLALLLWLPPLNIEISAAVVTFGMVIGELASLLYLHYCYYHSKQSTGFKHTSQSSVSLIKNILAIAFPVTFTRLISSVMMAANSILIPQRLMTSGMNNHQAISTFGIISGMVLPLLFFPFTLTSALSVVIIPNISESVALKNWVNINDKISKSILITCLTAFPCMALLVPLAHPIGIAIYNQPDVGKYLVPLSCFIIFFCLQHTLGSTLNGLGKQNRAAVHFIIGGSIQILCTYFLVARPGFGIYGFIIGFILSSIIVSSLNFFTVIHIAKIKIRWIKWFGKPILAASVMGALVYDSYVSLTSCGMFYIYSLIIAAITGLLVFLLILIVLGYIPYSYIRNMTNKIRAGRK
ncbi:MAG: stage V sporulation protein B [Clostridia bacterium]